MGNEMFHYASKLEVENNRLRAANAQLEAENARLRSGLEPFCFGDPVMEEILWGKLPDDATGTITVKLRDFRRARAALAAQDGG